MKWNNGNRTLTIGGRKGNYPGMLQTRSFNIVVVGKSKGTGLEPTLRFDKVVNYSGGAVNVRL
jgi:alpha-D-xyloside xylohydrolase